MIRQTLLYLPSGVLGPLIQVVQVLVLTYWLTPAEVGLQAVIVALQELLHLLALVWWSQYILRYLDNAQGPERPAQDRTEILLIVLTVIFQSGLTVGLVTWLAGPSASWGLALTAAAATVGRSVVTHWSVRARSEQEIGCYALAQIGAPAVSLGAMLLLFAVLKADLTIVFAATALGHGVILCLMWPKLNLGWRMRPIEPRILRAAVRYGSYALGGALLAWVSFQAARFTNEAFLGTAAVGLMSVGWGLGTRIAQQLAMLTTTAAFPLAVEKARKDGLKAGLLQLSQGGTLLFALIMPATAGITILAAPLSRLLTAEPFHEMTAMVLPLAFAASAVRVIRHNYLDEVLQLAERPALMMRIDAADAGATVLLCILGAWLGGTIGSVVGCVIASAAVTLLAIWVVYRVVAFSVDMRAYAKIAVATSVMTCVLAALPLPTGAAGLGLEICAAIGIYGATLLIIARNELMQFRNLIR